MKKEGSDMSVNGVRSQWFAHIKTEDQMYWN